MAVSAQIKLTQGATTDAAGRALVGVLASPVTATNGDDTNVVYWEWEVIGVPTGSTLATGIKTQGGVASFMWTPDVRGSYLLHLITRDRYGFQAEDFRVFCVLEASGRRIPAYAAGASALNFGGQAFGWHPYMEEWLHQVDVLTTLVGPGGSGVWAIKSANYTIAVAGEKILADMTGAPWTLKLPPAPVLGQEHEVKDYLGNAAASNLTLDGNGKNVEQFGGGTAATLVLYADGDAARVVYNGTFWSLA